MKKFMIAFAVAFSVIASATPAPSQDEIMPVLFEEADGQQFPIIAKKDGAYFPVYLVKGQQPYFADANGTSHAVSNGDVDYPVFYEKEGNLVAVPEGKSKEAAILLTSGDSNTHLVTFRRYRYNRGYYRYYPRYYRNYYYPRRSYVGYGGYYNYGYNRGYNYGYNYNYGYSYYRGYYNTGCYGYTVRYW